MKKVVLFVTVALLGVFLISCGSKVEWPDTKLGNMLPVIEDAKGEIGYESTDSLRITLKEISEQQYYDYIESCKEKGFTVDVKEETDSFVAFNQDGYKVDLSYFSDGDLWIEIEVPISMSTITWPKSEIVSLLPVPKSNYGKINSESDSCFIAYLGNTSKTEYDAYVEAVYAQGFSVDYNKGTDFFYGDNADGYSVSIKYEGFNTMFVRIDEPEEETVLETSMQPSNPQQGEKETQQTPSQGGNNTIGIDPDFKAAMDSYEQFFDEYCTFMKKYSESDDPLSMMDDYAKFMSQYAETMSKIEALEEGDMNTAEAIYYAEVMNRINKKLLEVTG